MSSGNRPLNLPNSQTPNTEALPALGHWEAMYALLKEQNLRPPGASCRDHFAPDDRFQLSASGTEPDPLVLG
jgi:hypothetical protein